MAAGELGVFLSLRGRAEMVAGLREVSSGVRGMTKALKETGAQAQITDAQTARVYRPAHGNGIRSLSKDVDGLGQSLRRAGSFALSFAPLVGLAGVGGLVAGLEQAVTSATKLQSAMTQLTTEAGVKASQLPALTMGAKQVAAQTGVSATDVASNELFHIEGTFNKEHRPLSNADALAMARTISETAQIEPGASTDDVAKAFSGLAVTGIRGAQGTPDQLAGKLLSIVGAGGTMRMSDLAQAVSSGLIPNLKALGLGLDDVGGALATMTDNGVPAETGIRTLTTSLMHVQKPTSAGAAALAAIGISQLQLATDLRKPNGLVTMIGDLGDHLDRLPGGRKGVQAQDVVASIFGGSKGTGPIQLLLNQTANLTSNIDKISQSGASTFTQAWDVTEKTFAVQKERLQASAENLASRIGTAVLPVLGRITGSIATFAADASGPAPPAGMSAFARANAADATSSLGGRGRGAATDLMHGNLTMVASDLGLTGPAASGVSRALLDTKAIVGDIGRITTDDIVPGLRVAGTILGGTLGVGLHLLRDTTDAIADHATVVHGVLDAVAAVLAVKAAGSGIEALSTLPGKLASMPTAVLDWLKPDLGGKGKGMGKLGDEAFVQKVYVVNDGFGKPGNGLADETSGGSKGLLGGIFGTIAGGAGSLASTIAGSGSVASTTTAVGGALPIFLGATLGPDLGQLIWNGGKPFPHGLTGGKLADYQAAVKWLGVPANAAKLSASEQRQVAYWAKDVQTNPSNQADILSAQHLEGVIMSHGGPVPQQKAAGGPVVAGTMYEVNERGREFFVPNMPGTVLSASQTERMLSGRSGGSGPTVVVQPGAVVVNGYGVTDGAGLQRLADAAVDRMTRRISDAAARA